MPNGGCSLSDCSGAPIARGLCRTHYNRWHYAGDPKSTPRATECAECGAELVPNASQSGPPATYCSKLCRSRSGRKNGRVTINARLRDAHAARISQVVKSCPGCGESFTPSKSVRQAYCSPACSKRVQNAARRAKVRGAYVQPLHWRALREEDGAECHICGYDTDPTDFKKATRGAIVVGMAYPTLDHVIPLAEGGLHERANVKLAHFYCNSVKGARPLAEVARPPLLRARLAA